MQTLVLFGRVPQRGAVKRRLAASIGQADTIRFYRTLLAALPQRLRDPRWRIVLALTPQRAPWRLPRGCSRVEQGRGDLGARMRRVLGKGAGPVVLVGTDIPDVSRALIAAAFRQLLRHRFAFGPSEDGGYWLVGIRGRRPCSSSLFRGVRWSSESALADTLATLPFGASAGFVATLRDIDNGEDWAALRARGAKTLR
jgi:rSAM/selenodomain-associated transferase 1